MSFYTEKYPMGIWVNISSPDYDSWVDGIKGLNTGHALWRASQNWDGCIFEVISVMEPAELRFS